jgi:aminopeptidase N
VIHIRTRHVALLLGALALLASAAFAGSARAADGFTPGSAGLGDPFFPNAGNGGYDVTNYSLTLSYEPETNQLAGTAVIRARATQDLSRFNLDLRGFTISQLLVDGRASSFARDGQELIITPRQPGIRTGTTFTVTVGYAGTPAIVTDPDQSIEGWIPTDDGAFVVGEPQGSPAWYPANDNPRDKATYDFAVTVPAGLKVMANGVLISNVTQNGRTTWVWRETDPMSPYLATATLGRFDLTVSTVSGIPSYVAVDPQLPSGQVLSKLPDIVAFYISIYGPYPLNAVGSVVDSAREVGYSLETQTKPVYDRMPDEATLAHELSHMWYGDSVTLTQWPDIWLHEGFATWSEWIWSEHSGNRSAHSWFEHLYNTPAHDIRFWTPPPANPGTPVFLFNGTIYYRGAMTLQALREKVGDFAFFGIMRTWATQNRYGNVTTAQFITLSEQISGMDLDHFFDVWLYQPEKPTSW